jgi:hypothetical protein
MRHYAFSRQSLCKVSCDRVLCNLAELRRCEGLLMRLRTALIYQPYTLLSGAMKMQTEDFARI